MAQADRAVGPDFGDLTLLAASYAAVIKNCRFSARVTHRDNAAIKDGVDFPKVVRKGYSISGTIASETTDNIPLVSLIVGNSGEGIAFVFDAYTTGKRLSGNCSLSLGEIDVSEEISEPFEALVQGEVTESTIS